MRTLKRFKWSCDFNLDKWSSTMKQRRSEDVSYEDGTLTPIINSFAKERSSLFKIHGTSPSLKYHELEGPMPASNPVLSNHLGQCFFLSFELIRYFLTDNVSFCFDDMFLHKEDETFLNMCMGSISG